VETSTKRRGQSRKRKKRKNNHGGGGKKDLKRGERKWAPSEGTGRFLWKKKKKNTQDPANEDALGEGRGNFLSWGRKGRAKKKRKKTYLRGEGGGQKKKRRRGAEGKKRKMAGAVGQRNSGRLTGEKKKLIKPPPKGRTLGKRRGGPLLRRVRGGRSCGPRGRNQFLIGGMVVERRRGRKVEIRE